MTEMYTYFFIASSFHEYDDFDFMNATEKTTS